MLLDFRRLIHTCSKEEKVVPIGEDGANEKPKRKKWLSSLLMLLLVVAAAGLGLGLGLRKKDDPPPVVRTQVTSVLRFEISASNFSSVDIGEIAAAGAQVSSLPGPTPAPDPFPALQRSWESRA